VSVSAKKALRACGLLLSAAAVAWIGIRFARSGALDLLGDASIGPGRLALVLAGAAGAYAIALSILGLAWWRLTSALAQTAPPLRPIIATWAVSQYGKYLPGNIAHYALRHAWSRRYGLSHASLGVAALLEAALLLLAALGLTLLADTGGLRGLSFLDPGIAIVLLATTILALGVGLQFARNGRLAARWHVPALPSIATLAFCLACCASFFLIGAGLLDGIAYALGFEIGSFSMLLAASAASWAAGFVVLGAPGGLGVREAAFVALAGGALGESRGLLLIGLFRIVTFLGDTLLFAAGAAALRRAKGVAADPSQDPRSAP
jgi:uncharacterized membrane protein YbhN (UPF0104 family)